MTSNGLPENIEQILTELAGKSRGEINLVAALADAIRQADEQLLREVRSVTLHHELRREQIMGELQSLAERLCALPARPLSAAPAASIPHHAARATPPPIEQDAGRPGGHWRDAVQKIDAELDEAFGTDLARH